MMVLLRVITLLLTLSLLTQSLLAQTLTVSPTDSVIRVDGLLNESVWQRAPVATNFTQNFPNDTLPAYNNTEVRVTYDHQFLYVSAVCYDKNRDKPFIATSLKRDWEWDFNDNFGIYIDPYGDRVNGFAFYTTPYGVEREGQLFNGDRLASEWDNKWRSATKVFPDRWQLEMAIPFKSFRYRKGAEYFLMNFARNDLKNNQKVSWKRVPIAYRISALAFADTVRFTTPLPNPGPNISLIPYVSTRLTDDRNEGGSQQITGGAGFDAKIGLTPSLNLDLTVNPDFSQVEADQQVTNLSRFEISYPERRQFFIENQDLFSQFGFESSRAFFSRRIGISRDTTTGIIVQNPILYGARLSGKIDKYWRVGLLNTQTANQASRGIAGQNYTVGVVQRQVFGRSNISAFYAGREGSGDGYNSRFTRIAGVEYNLQTDNNHWSGKAFFHQAFKPEQQRAASSHGLSLNYNIRNLAVTWKQEYIGRNYAINDLGYAPRTGYWKFSPTIQGTFYLKGEGAIVSHGPLIETNIIRNHDGGILTDRELDFGYNVQARNTSEGGIGYFNYYTRLYFPFDPTNSNGKELETNTDYTQTGWFATYTSDRRKRFNMHIEGFSGGYYNGTGTNLILQGQYRFQPYGAVSLSAEYNNIQLPEPYKSATYLLLGPRLDLTVTRALFMTTFIQGNNQTHNINLNTRLQWRFAPVSDLFIVYTENYLPGSFTRKNRALVLKLSYWLNL